MISSEKDFYSVSKPIFSYYCLKKGGGGQGGVHYISFVNAARSKSSRIHFLASISGNFKICHYNQAEIIQFEKRMKCFLFTG